MRSNVILGLVMAAAGCGARGAFPTIVIPPRPTAEDWPDAGAAILEDVATLDIRVGRVDTDDPRSVIAILDHRRRLKILSDEGLSAARVELPVDGWSTVSDIVARAVLPSGATVDMSSSSVAFVPSRAGDESGVGVVQFTVPDVAVGGLIDYRYRRVYRDAALLPTWVFGGRYPVTRAELAVVYDNEIKLDYRFGRGERVAELLPVRHAENEGRERLLFVQQNLPAYYPEPFSVHPARFTPWLAIVVTSARLGESMRRCENWDDVGRWLDDQVRSVGKASAVGPPSTIYRTIRDGTRVLPFFGLAGTRPQTATTLASGVLTTSRDASAVLRTTLTANGIDAAIALLSSPAGPPVLRDFPGLYGFTRALVAIRVQGGAVDRKKCTQPSTQSDPACRIAEGGVLLLDPSCPRCRYGDLPWDAAAGEALVLWRDKPVWVSVPAIAPDQHRIALQYDLKVDGQGVVRGRLTGRATGSAAAQLAEALRGQTDVNLALALYGDQGNHPGLSHVEVVTVGNAEQDLSFSADVHGQIERQGYGQFVVRPIDVMGPILPGEWRSNRRVAAVLPVPIQIDQVLKLDLPLVFDSEALPQVRLGDAQGDFVAACERHERTLSCAQRLRMRRAVVPAQEWSNFKRFTDQLAEHERHGVRVRLRD